MLIMRDFRCEHCQALHERMVEKEIEQIICPDCGHTAVKVLSPTFGRVLGVGWQGDDNDPKLI